MKFHGMVIWPPSQPSKDEQKQTSWADRGTAMEPLVEMQRRSEAAEDGHGDDGQAMGLEVP